MTLAIKHRESFGYGSSTWPQRYVSVGNGATVRAWDGNGVQFVQWGRGISQQGWAMRGNTGGAVGLLLERVGITPAASGFGTAIAYNQGGALGNATIMAWVEVYDDAGHYFTHLSLETDGFGHILARQGGSNDVLGRSTQIFPPGANAAVPPYTHIEVIPVLHASTGSIQVKVDGVLWLNLANKNTLNSDTSKGTGICHIINIGVSNFATVTDWITTNGAGWVGDKRVGYFPAAAIGTYTAGEAIGAATLKECVDEVTSDDDSTYIKFDDVGLPKAVSFTTTPLPTECTEVIEVSPLVISRKDDAGTNTHRLALISGGTEDDGGVDVPTPSGHTPEERGYMQDPETDDSWLIADADAVEVVYRRIA